MLTIKSLSLLTAGALVVAGGALAPQMATAAAPTSSASRTADAHAPKYSDDELLLAALFGAGPAATAIGVHVTDQAPVAGDYDEIASEVLASFSADHADVTKPAVAALRSGDPIRVHDAVAALQAGFQKVYLDEAPTIENGALCATVNLVLAGNLAVFINLAIGVAVALVTYVVTYQAQSESDAELVSARLSDLGLE